MGDPRKWKQIADTAIGMLMGPTPEQRREFYRWMEENTTAERIVAEGRRAMLQELIAACNTTEASYTDREEWLKGFLERETG